MAADPAAGRIEASDQSRGSASPTTSSFEWPQVRAAASMCAHHRGSGEVTSGVNAARVRAYLAALRADTGDKR